MCTDCISRTRGATENDTVLYALADIGLTNPIMKPTLTPCKRHPGHLHRRMYALEARRKMMERMAQRLQNKCVWRIGDAIPFRYPAPQHIPRNMTSIPSCVSYRSHVARRILSVKRAVKRIQVSVWSIFVLLSTLMSVLRSSHARNLCDRRNVWAERTRRNSYERGIAGG